MTDINLQTITPDTTLPTTGFLFGADSQASGSPSVYTVQSVATTLLGSTTLTGATITTSQPVLDLAQTWNAGGVTFTGLKLNATDTASAAGSLLLDIGTGGGTYASQLSVSKTGLTTVAGSLNNPALRIGTVNNHTGIVVYNFAVAKAYFGPYHTTFNSLYSLQWSSSTTAILNDADLFLTRRDTANLRFGAADAAAPVPQTLSVQSVVAGTSNTAGANLTITGSQGTGTGAGGSIIFQVAPAGGAGTAQNALATAWTINSASQFIYGNAGTAAAPSLVLSGADTGFFSAAGDTVGFGSGGNESFRLEGILGIGFRNSALLWWSSVTNGAYSNRDLVLARDTSNTLAQRNANNGQIFRLYGRYTDITNNFERFFINAPTTSGDAVQLGTQKGATTGAARALELQTDATTRLTIAATSGNITTTGSVTTQAPTGGTAAAWRLGTVASVTPTSQDRTIEVDIGGTIYYISAKTTND